MSAVLAVNGLLVVACMLALWLVSLRLCDASIADVFWGAGFAAVAIASLALSPRSPRALLLAAMATAWGLRLALHLGRRWRGKGEDRRYRAMRDAWGSRFPAASLFTVFLLQGALMWMVSLPLQAGALLGAGRPLGLLDALGLASFGIGLCFEAASDGQLARFLSDPGNAGKVMQTGLWRYTRHPNYFGDALVWWGIGLVASSAGPWWSLAGPALMTFLLLRVSGVALLERDIRSRRPDYADYVARTSAFFPWPPRKARAGEGKAAWPPGSPVNAPRRWPRARPSR
jgi:steroid 5-alpha reductase family enzyme